MGDLLNQLPGWLGHPGPWPVYALGAFAGLMFALTLLARWLPYFKRPSVRADDVVTYLAAAMATGFSIDGMYRVAGQLGMRGMERGALCAFMEVALVACALRARRNVKDFGREGTDGSLVWAFAILTGIFGASVGEGMGAFVRFCVPLIAAVMWQRGLNNLRRRLRPEIAKSIAWKWTSERLAIWLGLADPAERTTSDVAKARRIARLIKTRIALAALEPEPRSRPLAALTFRGTRRAYVAARLRNQSLAAVEHLGLGRDPEVMRQITQTVAAVVNLPELTDPRTVGKTAPARKPEGKAKPAKPPKPEPAAEGAGQPVPEPRSADESGPEVIDLADLEAAWAAPTREERVAAVVAGPGSTREKAQALLVINPAFSHRDLGELIGVSHAAVGKALRTAIASQDGGGDQ
jgi:hypothetical protein